MVKEHKLFIATPAFGFQAYINYINSVIEFATTPAPSDLKYSTAFHIHAGSALITHARNDCVDKFLKSDATKLLFIDADMGFKPENIWRLLRKDADIALAPYITKALTGPSDSKFIIKFANEEEPVMDEDGFIEILAGPTGFMMIDRSVFTKMSEAYPENLAYMSQIQNSEIVSTNNYPTFFDCITTKEDGALGEDISFCRRWTKLGGKIWADSQAALTHFGTFSFQGQLAQSLSKKD